LPQSINGSPNLGKQLNPINQAGKMKLQVQGTSGILKANPGFTIKPTGG